MGVGWEVGGDEGYLASPSTATDLHQHGPYGNWKLKLTSDKRKVNAYIDGCLQTNKSKISFNLMSMSGDLATVSFFINYLTPSFLN